MTVDAGRLLNGIETCSERTLDLVRGSGDADVLACFSDVWKANLSAERPLAFQARSTRARSAIDRRRRAAIAHLLQVRGILGLRRRSRKMDWPDGYTEPALSERRSGTTRFRELGIPYATT